MQFLLIAKDGNDDEAADRRTAAQADHIKHSDFAAQTGEQIIAADLLGKNNEKRGSAMIVEFDNVEKLQEWLKHEPFMTGNVWKDIDVIPCEIAPNFKHIVKKSRS